MSYFVSNCVADRATLFGEAKAYQMSNFVSVKNINKAKKNPNRRRDITLCNFTCE